MSTTEILKGQKTVTVCSECLQAACWQGKFFCEKYQTAGTVEKTVAELQELGLEHPSYWQPLPKPPEAKP